MTKIVAIAAMDEGRVIGRDGDLPWRIPEDLKRFQQLTNGHTVLMGRKTYLSLPSKSRPLPGRTNIVCTRDPSSLSGEIGIQVVESAAQYLDKVRSGATKLATDLLWVLGGGEIYRQTLPFWDEIYLTFVKDSFEGDAFFPEFESRFDLVESQDRGEHEFRHYVRKAQL